MVKNTTLHLTVDKDCLPVFFQLLGQGFRIEAQVGCTVRELLNGQLGLSDDYLDQKIQTLFLDGKAVDDMDAALVSQGSILALSAAMPGLAGATLRRGGAYAAMRRQISHQKPKTDRQIKDGKVTLKLFNLVARDLGPIFLKQGILIRVKTLQTFFSKAFERLRDGCRFAEMDGYPLQIQNLNPIEWAKPNHFVRLVVEAMD